MYIYWKVGHSIFSLFIFIFSKMSSFMLKKRPPKIMEMKSIKKDKWDKNSNDRKRITSPYKQILINSWRQKILPFSSLMCPNAAPQVSISKSIAPVLRLTSTARKKPVLTHLLQDCWNLKNFRAKMKSMILFYSSTKIVGYFLLF